MSWKSAKKDAEAEPKYQPKTYTDADVEGMFKPEEDATKRPKKSIICSVHYGWDGTGKSGVVLDSRSDEERENDAVIICLDMDNSMGPLADKYFHADVNKSIFILDPIVLHPEAKDKQVVDFVSTYNKTLAITKYIFENQTELRLHAMILDGLDTLLKSCEYVMKYEDLKKDPDAQIKDSWQWHKRNARFLAVVHLVKAMGCDRYYTTHFKEVRKYLDKQLQTIGRNPNWERSTPGIMFQKVHHIRSDIKDDLGEPIRDYEGEVKFEAIIEKAKGALHLEGAKYLVARSDPANRKFEWFGLHEFFKELKAAPGA